MRLLVLIFLVVSVVYSEPNNDAFEQRQQIRTYLRDGEIEKIRQLPAMRMRIPITDNVVYLWPKERMLLGAILGNYAYPSDDEYIMALNKASRDIKDKLQRAPDTVSIPHDILYEELVEYTAQNLQDILARAEKSGLPKVDLDFLDIVLMDTCMQPENPALNLEAINNAARSHLAEFPRSRYRAAVQKYIREYRLKKWPLEFSLGYGFSALQGNIRNYLDGVKYLAADLGLYKKDMFLALQIRLGYGTSEVKTAFGGGSWLPGDSFQTLVAMDFGVGYRFSVGKYFDIKPFAGLGFTLVSRDSQYEQQKDRPIGFGADLGPCLGFYVDIRVFSPGAAPGMPKHLEAGYAFLRIKAAYHVYLAPIAGDLGDGAYYISLQLGLLANEYERVSVHTKENDTQMPSFAEF